MYKYLLIFAAALFYFGSNECLAISNENMQMLYNKASAGDVESQVKIADIFYANAAYTDALEWYFLAGKNGDSYAINKIGNMIYNGEGIEKDLSLARKIYTIAAQKGNKFAQYNLGNFWYHGQGGEKNLEEAGYWLELSCKNGYNKACNDIKFIFKRKESPLQKNYAEDNNIIEEVRGYLKSLKE